MLTLFYILDKNNKPIREPDMQRWAEWMKSADKTVGLDETMRTPNRWSKFTYKVSTVFLGINHSFDLRRGAPPILFETMIFAGENNKSIAQHRYATYEEAQIGHAELLARVVAGAFDPTPKRKQG